MTNKLREERTNKTNDFADISADLDNHRRRTKKETKRTRHHTIQILQSKQSIHFKYRIPVCRIISEIPTELSCLQNMGGRHGYRHEKRMIIWQIFSKFVE